VCVCVCVCASLYGRQRTRRRRARTERAAPAGRAAVRPSASGCPRTCAPPPGTPPAASGLASLPVSLPGFNSEAINNFPSRWWGKPVAAKSHLLQLLPRLAVLAVARRRLLGGGRRVIGGETWREGRGGGINTLACDTTCRMCTAPLAHFSALLYRVVGGARSAADGVSCV
jgi:hypothetical protein